MFRRGNKSSYDGTFLAYIPGLLQRAPMEDLYASDSELAREMVSPDMAADELQMMGITESEWGERLQISGDVDSVRAYIIIAIGTQKRSVHILDANLIALDAMSGQDGTAIGVGPILRQELMQTPAIAHRIGEIVSSN